MGYNNKIYKKIYDEYTTKYLSARARADAKKAELHSKLPEIAVIDKKLSNVGLEIFAASFCKEDDRENRLAKIKENNVLLQEQRKMILLKNGYPEDYSDVKYECDTCRDCGFVDNKMCSCMKQALIYAGFENSGIASLIKEQSFQNYSLDYFSKDAKTFETMKHNKEFLQSYAEGFDPSSSKGILMVGGTGLGKTHLSSALAKRIIERGFDVFYTGAIDMFSQFEHERFKSGFSNDENDIIERYYDCDLLIIDDLGTELVNQFSVSTLYNLINVRLSNKRPTVISTNLTKKEMNEKYTDRITSRLLGESFVLPFIGTDVRLQRVTAKK